MDEQLLEFIDSCKEGALAGEYIGRDAVLRLLSIDTDSQECEYLGRAGREVAIAVTENRGRIGTSFGMDLAPCSMNCKFCSLGEKWHLFEDSYEYSAEDIIPIIKKVVSRGFYQFTIRTTEFYTVEKLCDLARSIRAAVPNRLYLTLNGGELSEDDANALYESGFNAAYHTVRLGEGVDTEFDPADRLKTMKNISRSKLALSTGLDPIGIEHTNEMFADQIELFRRLGAATVCVMKRISVKGTPMEDVEEISERRVAHIAAVVRLAGAGVWKNVAESPALNLPLEWGANCFGITTGANPRFSKQDLGRWFRFDHDEAIRTITGAGFVLSDPMSSINSKLIENYKGRFI